MSLASKADAMHGVVILMPRWLLPVRPRLQVQANMAVVIHDGRIAAVLPCETALETYTRATRIDLPEHVLLPGLINMHTHAAMTLLRGYADDINLQTWLHKHIWPVEKMFLSPEFVHDGSKLAIAEMLRGGTTFFNDNYFYPEITAAAAVESGMRACIGLPVIDARTVWATDADECIDKGMQVCTQWQGEDLISTSFAPHAPYSVGDKPLQRIAKLAQTHDMRVHMHVLESKWEIGESQRRYAMPTLDRLKSLDLLNNQLLAVHMTQLEGHDFEMLSGAQVNVVHCPESNLKLGSGICPLTGLLEHGVNVTLGTDGAASNNDLDLLAEARSAALLAKGESSDPCAVNAFQTLEMLTINAAQALGLAERIGTIEVGKLADLCAIDLGFLNTIPTYDVVSQIIYAVSSHQVSHVWVGGRMLLCDGEFLYLDIDSMFERARYWAEKIGYGNPRSGVAES